MTDPFTGGAKCTMVYCPSAQNFGWAMAHPVHLINSVQCSTPMTWRSQSTWKSCRRMTLSTSLVHCVQQYEFVGAFWGITKTIHFWKPPRVINKKMHVSILSYPMWAAILDFEKQRPSNTDVSIYRLLGLLLTVTMILRTMEMSRLVFRLMDATILCVSYCYDIIKYVFPVLSFIYVCQFNNVRLATRTICVGIEVEIVKNTFMQ